MRRLLLVVVMVAVSFTVAMAQNKAVPSKGAKVLFQGDSITDCYRDRGSNNKYGFGYMFLCTAHYMAAYPERGFVFINRGISGHTLADLHARWDKDALDLNPDVLSLLIGINDIASFVYSGGKGEFPFDKWEAEYRRLLDRSLLKNPNLKLVLAEPFLFKLSKMATRWDEMNRYTRRCGQIVKKIAEDYSAVFLPYQSMFDQALEKAPAEYWIFDGVHPSVAGHMLMADLWKEKTGELK